MVNATYNFQKICLRAINKLYAVQVVKVAPTVSRYCRHCRWDWGLEFKTAIRFFTIRTLQGTNLPTVNKNNQLKLDKFLPNDWQTNRKGVYAWETFIVQKSEDWVVRIRDLSDENLGHQPEVYKGYVQYTLIISFIFSKIVNFWMQAIQISALCAPSYRVRDIT